MSRFESMPTEPTGSFPDDIENFVEIWKAGAIAERQSAMDNLKRQLGMVENLGDRSYHRFAHHHFAPRSESRTNEQVTLTYWRDFYPRIGRGVQVIINRELPLINRLEIEDYFFSQAGSGFINYRHSEISLLEDTDSLVNDPPAGWRIKTSPDGQLDVRASPGYVSPVSRTYHSLSPAGEIRQKVLASQLASWLIHINLGTLRQAARPLNPEWKP